jgi:gluconate 2-dehydrogenase gamma chain
MTTESGLSRRELFRRLGLAGIAACAMPELSQVLLFRRTVEGATQGGPIVSDRPTTLSPAEAATLAAICARLIPTDENGPGATEARASQYIDRELSGALASSREAYGAGLADVNARAQAEHGLPFSELSATQQDGALTAIEQTPFFALVRAHTLQGTFCDTAYGGNANFVGWDLIGYPGVRLAVPLADQQMSSPAKPIRRSAYDYAMFSVAVKP